MFNISTLDKISKTGLALLPSESYAIADNAPNPDGIILRSFNMLESELPDSLLCVARAGAGVNNIPLSRCSEKGIVVFNTPGANANAVAELTIAGILLSSRKIFEGITWTGTLPGQGEAAKLVEKGKSKFAGPEISGKTLGIIGLGSIGMIIAEAALALGMKVIAFRGSRNKNPKINVLSDINELYAQADYISINAPYSADTKHMINKDSITKMKPSVRLLNFARAELCDNEAVKEAVASGHIACYVTDFPTDDLLNIPNIITIPHLGASTPESEENCAYMAAAQLNDYLTNGNIVNSVNFPNISLPVSGKRRVSAAFTAPEACEGFVAALGGLSVHGTRGTVTYTIVEFDGDCDVADLFNKFGAIKARVYNV